MLDVSGELLSQPCVDAGLELALSPTGRLYLEPGPGGYGGLVPARANRIGKAFERDAGTGLLHLGANEPASALPPSLAFGRAFAHLFVTRLCALPDLANQWSSMTLEPPRDEFALLLANAPPMTGAEYLDLACLERWWGALLGTVRGEIAADAGNVGRWFARQHPGWNMVGRVCFHLAENKASEQTPFAFLATYAAGVSDQARVRHLPLARAAGMRTQTDCIRMENCRARARCRNAPARRSAQHCCAC